MPPPTLILLPGLHGTADLFDGFLKVIPAEFPRRAISYPSDEYLSHDRLLEYIQEQTKEDKSLVLIAESFSGPLAVRFAAAHPDRVRAIVLCASFIRLPQPPWRRRLLAPLLFHLPILTAALRRYLVGPQAPRELVVRLRESLRQSRPSVLLARLRESFRADCTDALAHCRMPLLYLAGSEDRLIPSAVVDPIRAVRPDTIVVTIAGPHMLLQTQPAGCWREIHRFLRDNNTVR